MPNSSSVHASRHDPRDRAAQCAPELERRFRVPAVSVSVYGLWIGFAPAKGIVFCILTVAPLFDIVEERRRGRCHPGNVAGGYCALGANQESV